MRKLNTEAINATMKEAEIQAVAIASGHIIENIREDRIPAESQEEVFGAASLSKPVFSYLVLKLIKEGVLQLDTSLNEATIYDPETQQEKKVLTFAVFCEREGFNWADSQENRDKANLFTPELILSHQTGLPITYDKTLHPQYGNKPAPLTLEFEPGKEFGYSGLHMMYLQQWIEEKTGRTLESLAREYVFEPAKMSKKSTFNTPIGNAANSLYTTAKDYLLFCIHWMNDRDPLAQEAFQSKVLLTKDAWAQREQIPQTTLEHLAWGYGWGLEKNDKGEVIAAFHTGDMCEWRSGVRLDLTTKEARVFFSKSIYENGHVLQEEILGPSYALDYFFDKFKFARNVDELRSDWRDKRSFGARETETTHYTFKK